MKQVKRILALLMVAILVLAVAGCGNVDEEESGNGDRELFAEAEEESEEGVTPDRPEPDRPESQWEGEPELSNDYIRIYQVTGLEITHMEFEPITDEQVDSFIDRQLGQNPIRTEITDRLTEEGDQVEFDFLGSVDGVPFEGGAAEGHLLVLGSGGFIGAYGDYEGFEDQLIGREPGTTFDIEVQFPTDYFAPDLAGAVAVFEINLHAIVVFEAPELTDDWVQENSEYSQTVEEYREEIRNMMDEQNRSMIVDQQQGEVLRALFDNVELIAYPAGAVENELAELVDYYQELADMNGMELYEFMQMNYGMGEEEFYIEATNLAEDIVLRRLVIDLIMEAKGLELTDIEHAVRLGELFRMVGGFDSVDEFVAHFGEQTVNEALRQIIVAEFLVENSVPLN